MKSANIATVLAAPTIAYSLLFPWLRDFGEVALIPVVGSALLAGLVAKKSIVPPSYWPFLFFTLMILAFSFLDLEPSAWTHQRDYFAAVRHWFYVPALVIIASAVNLLVERYYQALLKYPMQLMIAAISISRLARFLSGDTDTPETGYFLYASTNDVVVIAALATFYVFSSKRSIIVDIIFLLILMALTLSAQLQIFWVLLILLRITRAAKLFVIVMLALTTAFLIWAPANIMTIHELDHNSGVRAVLWRDVWSALDLTAGWGVGYGTEYIRNIFSEFMSSDWTIGSSRSDIYVGTHSTYYDILLRDGIIGLFLFLWWYIPLLFRGVRGKTQSACIAAGISVLLIINSSINVGTSSVNFLFGSAICVAILNFTRIRCYGQELPSTTCS